MVFQFAGVLYARFGQHAFLGMTVVSAIGMAALVDAGAHVEGRPAGRRVEVCLPGEAGEVSAHRLTEGQALRLDPMTTLSVTSARGRR